jgi:cellulose synthase/poly-beta-1,6-N-acetylglucosamine synthase-like glycosyltransferase
MEKFEKIKQLADRPLKTEAEMGMVELVIMAYNEHDMVADVVGHMIKNANYPFKLTVLNNISQITPINFSRVWNKMINETTCDFIGFFDSDVFFQPDWLKRMMESFNDPEIELVVPVLDNTSSPQARAVKEASYPSFEPLREVVTGQAVIYRRSTFEKHGLFDERFLLYGQDSEWGVRFKKNGGKGLVRKDVFCHHIGSVSLKKFAEDNKDLYDASLEREYARLLFRHLIQ